MAKAHPKTPPRVVAAIYRSAPQPHRTTMLEMRRRILRIVPDAEEVVSYGIAAFRVDGTIVCGMLAARNHVGYYPFSGSVLQNFSKKLAGFSTTKSALHVPIDTPLSMSLLKMLIAARTSSCPVKTGTVDLSKYERLDGEWRALKLGAPARRALVGHKILRLRDLAKWHEADVKALHGIGNHALVILRREMKHAGVKYRPR